MDGIEKVEEGKLVRYRNIKLMSVRFIVYRKRKTLVRTIKNRKFITQIRFVINFNFV